MSMKNSNDTIGNPTRDFPACSAAPQPILTIQNVVKNKTVLSLSLTEQWKYILQKPIVT